MNPTLSQVHINAAMGKVSVAYRNPSYIAEQIFPVVPVNKQSDEYFVFDKASWFRNEAGPRAPATRGPQVEYSVSSSTYSCRPIAATKPVPDEVVANADSPLRPLREATEFATDKVLLYLEYDLASSIFADSVWTGSAEPSTTWDSALSDPVSDIEAGKETLVTQIGREPNVMVIGREVLTDLKRHPDLLELFKYTQSGLLTVPQIAQVFDIPKVLVGTGIYTSSVEGATATYSYIWGKYCLLAWVPPNPGLMVPAAGYTFTWKNRTVESFRREEEKATAVRCEMNYGIEITSADAGYLLKSVVA